jgi:penicillin-binding protein 1A
MARALVAGEDERFYQHHGIDVPGLLRAAWDNLRAWNLAEGGSTLTAQLAKNAYLRGYDHSIPLKLEDLLLAVKVEDRYSKDQILEMYLNLVYYGEGAYGIGEASQRYFGIAPPRLDLAQAALLAGLVQAPGRYDPWCHPVLARARQHEMLDRMQDDGYITAAQARAAALEAFSFWSPGATRPGDTYCAP